MSLHHAPSRHARRISPVSVRREALPRRIPRQKRERIEEAIEAHLAQADSLIAVLDRYDGDTDLEEDAADPTHKGIDEDELDGDFHEDDEDGGDDEPSLGGQDPGWENVDQTYWAFGNTDDREGDEHDGREYSWTESHGEGEGSCASGNDENAEPSLAHTNDLNQLVAQRHTMSHNLRYRGEVAMLCAASDCEEEHDGLEDDEREQVSEDEGADEHYFRDGAL
jgi:hypothetical protein